MLTLNATMIAVVLNFIILVLILNRFLYGPVIKLLDDRKSGVERTLNEAEAQMTSAKAFVEEGREAINKANSSAKEIIDQASKAAVKINKEAIDRSKKEIEEQKNRAKEEIRQMKIEAKRSIVGEAARLSVIIAEKIVLKKIDKKTQRTMVDRFIGKIGD